MLKFKKEIIIVLSFAILIFLALFGSLYYFPSKNLKELAIKNPPLSSQPPNQTTPSPIPSELPTPLWKTYTNKELGFSFEYPADWQFEESTFPGVSQKNIRLSFQPVNFTLEVNASASLSITSHSYEGYEMLSSEKITVGGESATKRTWQTTAKGKELYKDSYKAIDISFSHANNRYTLYINYKENNEPLVLQNFEHILSSFRFQDLVQKADKWLVYTNKEIGYTLKYPSDWQLEEVNTKSQVTDNQVKYIKIYEPKKKYFLYFGLKKSNQDFLISDRTGIGAEEIQQVSEKTLKILNMPVLIEALKSEGRVKEYFFRQPSGTDRTCGCQFIGGLAPIDEEFLETPSLSILDIPIKILSSANWQ
jgi:hypothetical protein